MKLGAELRGAINKIDDNLIITPRYEAWLAQFSDDPLSEELSQKLADEVSKGQRSRVGSFTGSGAGKCKRRQIFSYIGLRSSEKNDVLENSTRLMLIFYDGRWRHLRWQFSLLASKILDDIESPIFDVVNNVTGLLDGIGTVPSDHPNILWRNLKFGFELKGANPYVYQGMDSWARYSSQIARYFRARPDLDLYVIVVENKASQEYKEWVVHRSMVENLLREEVEELAALNSYVNKKSLPPLLSACQIKKGAIWEKCPYGGDSGLCVETVSWPKSKKSRKLKFKVS